MKKRNKITNFVKKASVFLSLFMTIGLPAVSVFAEVDADSVIHDLTNGSSDGGVFSGPVGKVKTVGADFYTFLGVIGLVVGIVVIAIAGISMSATKNSNSRSENKSWIPYIVLGLGVVFSAGSMVSLIYGIAKSL